jgi:WD40 repeat protein/serine/threonine protein kinase
MDLDGAPSSEEALADWLARYDESLAGKGALPNLSRDPAPDELRTRLQEDVACLQLLQQLRPPASVQAVSAAPAAEPVAPEPATVDDRYHLLRLHATGGIGRVWLAWDGELGRCVALKDLHPDKAQHALLRARFLREIQITSQLQHPGIVPVYDLMLRPVPSGEVEPLYTMRFIQGRTLTAAAHAYHAQRRAGKARARDLVALLNAFLSAANTVAYAHSRGVIHRDLKGQNVVLGDFGEVVVLDWGLAKVREPGARGEGRGAGEDLSSLAARHPSLATPPDQSLLGQIIGTPAYMAPEQAAGRPGDADERTDVHGLGAILYEILTGQPPFTDTDTRAILHKVCTSEPTRPSAHWPGVPRPLEAVCQRALARGPERRYASVADLVQEVQNWLVDEPVKAYPEPRLARLRRWARHHKPIVAGVAVLLLTGLVAGVVGVLALGEERTHLLEVRAEAARERALADARARRELETQTYFQRIALAEREVTAGNFSRAIHYLSDCPPGLRGWEWHCLQRRCRTDLLTLRGHHSAVAAIVFSPAGDRLASAGHDRTILLWDAATGELLRTIRGHTDAVYALAYSPDGRRLVSASWDRTLKLWDTSTGNELRTFGPHKEDVYRVAFSPDGRYIASATAGNTLHLWDAETGQERLTRTEKHSFFGVAFGPTEPSVLATSHLRSIRLWDHQTGEEKASLDGHDSLIKVVTFSPDGRLLASGAGDLVRGDAGEVRVWDLLTRHLIATFRGHTDPIYGLAFAPRGRYLASASQDKTVKLWDLVTGQEALTLRGHTDTVRSLAFSPDGYRLATASADWTIKIWDATPWSQEWLSPEVLTLSGNNGRVIGAAFSPDGRVIASGSDAPAIKVWDARTGAETRSIPVSPEPLAVAFSPDGTYLASSHSDSSVRVLDVRDGHEVFRLEEPQLGVIRSVAFSPDGRRLAAGGWWRTVQVWDLGSREKLFTLTRHTQPVLAVAFGPRQRYLASAGYDQTVMVWDAQTGEHVHTLGGHASRVQGIAFSPNGDTLASGSHDGTVKLWDTSTWKVIRTLRGHAAGVNGVAFTPDGRRLVTAGDDWALRIWDAKTGEEVRTLRGHSDRVQSVAVSPDGRRLVSCSYDRSVKVWEMPR